MAFLDLDTDILRGAVTTAKNANTAITEAQRQLDAIVHHNDWACEERDKLNANTDLNKEKAREIQSHSDAFYQAIDQSSLRFEEAENEMISVVNRAEELLSQILSIVPGISAVPDAPAIASFDNISDSLEG